MDQNARQYEYHGFVCGNIGEPPSKPKYTCVIDSTKYREGKVKKYPGRGVKSSWNGMPTSSRSSVE